MTGTMAEGDRKGPGRGGAKDVDDLKARLGLKVRREPPPAAAPPPAPEPTVVEREPFAADPTTVSPAAPEITQRLPRSALPVEETYAPNARVSAPPPARTPAPPLWVEEAPPPPKSLWQRWGRTMAVGLAVALAGGLVGFVFGKGASRGSQLARVKKDAEKIGGAVKSAFTQVEAVAAALSPSYASAKQKGGTAKVEAILRTAVDWTNLDAIAKFELPKELETVFDTDFFKLLGGSRIRLFSGFLVDFQRLAQSVRDHVERTKASRAQLDADAQAGQGGRRAYAVIVTALPGLDRGEIVLLRARRVVKSGEEETVVFDVAKPAAPAQPIAVPATSLIVLNAPGLLKTGSALLEEYNRRMRELAFIVQRLLDTRDAVLNLVEKVAAAKG